jgi:Domain of unknown function (DUF4845)
MGTRAGQSGISIIGFLFVAALVLSLAIIGFRVLPSYIEYFSVVRTLQQTLDAAPDGEPLAQFRRDFDLKASVGYIDSVRGPDVDLTKEDNKMVASADWTKTLPLVGNVSLLLDFHASASK